MSKEILRIQCDCGHKGHFFALEKWLNEGEILATVCEADSELPFFLRLKYAFLYLLGRQHLNYTEIVLDREWTLKKLKEAIEK